MERVKMAEAESLETAAEHERILREIESTDTACIGPTLRGSGMHRLGVSDPMLYPGASVIHGVLNPDLLHDYGCSTSQPSIWVMFTKFQECL
ncbi:hypothetical protein E5288_WYG017326 [Bos mutus]|uniref:Uncharacterized protein n=1 Tax=Bos mutus TaxID=72004 RepID=A0A6B0RM50_9CETA|nr:hypothetical protein [Bos mutus]